MKVRVVSNPPHMCDGLTKWDSNSIKNGLNGRHSPLKPGFCTLLLLAAMAGAVSSCASVDAHTKQYAGVPQQQPSEAANVQVLRSAPNQPYQKLGEIVVDASTMPDAPDQKVQAKLKEEAAKLGADAAVVVVDRIQPEGMAVTGAYWNRTVDTVDERKVVAVAIKYGTLTPTGRP